MKRLFKVVIKEGMVVYFETKVAAKVFRDEQGECHVSRGPDHMGKHGHKVVRMRLQPKRVK